VLVLFFIGKEALSSLLLDQRRWVRALGYGQEYTEGYLKTGLQVVLHVLHVSNVDKL
jgi:hypothetical protein